MEIWQESGDFAKLLIDPRRDDAGVNSEWVSMLKVTR